MLRDALGPSVGGAVVRLAAVLDLPPPDHTPEQAREAADRILARPEYQWEDRENLFERILEWIVDRISDLLEPLGFGAGGLPVWFGWLVLVGLAALVGYLVYRARGGWSRGGPSAVARGARIVLSEGEAMVDWAAEVERAEREGRWRDALRARYRVLVADLASRGLIGDLVGRTTGELLGDVRRAAPPAVPAFTVVTEMFEETWYGGAPAGPAERDRFVALAAEVRAQAGRSSAPAGPR